MVKRSGIGWLGMVAACLGVAAPAYAGGAAAPTPVATPAPINATSVELLPGGAPLPEFGLNFVIDDPQRFGMRPAGPNGNLDISLTSPDKGVLRFLFSPRSQFLSSADPTSGSNSTYVGLTWGLFDSHSLFGNIGVAGTYKTNGFDDSHTLPLFSVHGAVELGYSLGQQHSLSLTLDRGHAFDPTSERIETIDNLRIRYGYKF
ncbi:MAG TPA: hypothetical protein VKT70_02225 [Stellaceae bacterium]|nr:hypothetical protein [Stellaceae bacterium]